MAKAKTQMTTSSATSWARQIAPVLDKAIPWWESEGKVTIKNVTLALQYAPLSVLELLEKWVGGPLTQEFGQFCYLGVIVGRIPMERWQEFVNGREGEQ